MINTVISLLLYLGGGLILLALAAFLLFSAYIYYIHRKLSYIPCPKLQSFYYGNVGDILQARKEAGNDELPFSEVVLKWYRDSGSSTFVVHFLHAPVVCIMDPEDIKELIMEIKNDKHPRNTNPFKELLGERFAGNSIVSILDYDTWKPRRRLYDSAFNRSYLKTFIGPFNKSVDKFLGKLKPLANGETVVPMKAHLAELTLDVISKVAFGMDFSEKWNDETLGLKNIKGKGSLTFLVSHSFVGLDKSFQNPFLFRFLHPFETEGYREAVRAIRMIGRDCIKSRTKTIENGEQVPNDILTHILQMASTKESVEIEELVDDFVAYYIAGQETTSNLLAFTTVLVHQHPHVLERLQSEVTEVLGTKDSVCGDDLEKLQYTEQVLMETLRLYPPVFGIIKQAKKGGVTLGGYAIPEGTQIMASTATLCRMPEYFDDPDTFNPSRWDPENKRPSAFVYFPFGLGHRSCIGKHFAMMEAKIALARLIQTYEITLPADYELVPAQRTTVQPKDGVPCTILIK